MTDPADTPKGLPDVVAGRYQTVSALGAGGMGTVYKAIDTRLNRAVAIKALHHTRLRELGAGLRLRAEALAAAALDHPYICKVYELIEDGPDTLIVMEFVEGETLAAMLKRGVPPLALTLQIGREIAEGLAAAHARGFVHRDVKPSNVMVTSHGHVKLLDFGLAQPDVASTPAAETRTSSARASSYSGTPHYMSPEAASGEPVTARADLFSLGAVLFEALSGKLPFAGSTPYDYVRHLLTSDPRPLYRFAPHAPADLTALVERCLEKVPAKRPESAGAVVAALSRLSESLTGTGVSLPTARAVQTRKRIRQWALAALAIVAALAMWLVLKPAPAEVVRRARPFIDWAGDETDSRVSPDGQWVSFISNRGGIPQLYIQAVHGDEAKSVTLLAGRPISHLWSTDGREIACVVADEAAMRIEIIPAFFGGRPRERVPIEIEPAPARVRLSRWIGATVYLQIDNPDPALYRADLSTRVLTNLSQSWRVDGRLMSFDVKPDGAEVAYGLRREAAEDLWIARTDGSSARAITHDAFFERHPIWTGDGTHVIVQSNRGGQIDLWEIDPSSGRATAITSSQTVEIAQGTSATGDVVSFHQESEDSRLWSWDVASGASRQLSSAGLNEATPIASRDGRLVAIQRRKATETEATLTEATLLAGPLDLAANFEPRPIAEGFAAQLSPDGRRLAFLERQPAPGRSSLVVLDIDTNERAVVSRAIEIPVNSPFPPDWVEHNIDWAPDGRELFFVDREKAYAVRRARVGAPPAGPAAALADIAPDGLARDVYVSPDGQSLTFLSVTSPPRANRTFHLQLIDLASGRLRTLAEIAGRVTGIYGRGWLANGREVVVMRAHEPNADRSATVDVLIVDLAGTVRRAASIERALVSTARVDPDGVVYVTRIEDGIPNVYRCTLATGALTRLTDNRFQGVTFSAMTPVGSNRLVGVRHEMKRDIWLIESTVGSTPSQRK